MDTAYFCLFFAFVVICQNISAKAIYQSRLQDAYIISWEYGDRFKNIYELLNLRALKSSCLNKIHIFQCMGKLFCVKFQRVPLKFHTKYLTHALKNIIFTYCWNFKRSWISELTSVCETQPRIPRIMQGHSRLAPALNQFRRQMTTLLPFVNCDKFARMHDGDSLISDFMSIRLHVFWNVLIWKQHPGGLRSDINPISVGSMSNRGRSYGLCSLG